MFTVGALDIGAENWHCMINYGLFEDRIRACVKFIPFTFDFVIFGSLFCSTFFFSMLNVFIPEEFL